MATAVEPGSEPRTPSPPMSLPVASLLGAVYVVAAIAGRVLRRPDLLERQRRARSSERSHS